eukprot:13694857-Ditylum_brightwellii.AAC.1
MDCCFHLSRSLLKGNWSARVEYKSFGIYCSYLCMAVLFHNGVTARAIVSGAMLVVLPLFDGPLFDPLSIAELLSSYVFLLFNEGLVRSE